MTEMHLQGGGVAALATGNLPGKFLVAEAKQAMHQTVCTAILRSGKYTTEQNCTRK